MIKTRAPIDKFPLGENTWIVKPGDDISSAVTAAAAAATASSPQIVAYTMTDDMIPAYTPAEWVYVVPSFPGVPGPECGRSHQSWIELINNPAAEYVYVPYGASLATAITAANAVADSDGPVGILLQAGIHTVTDNLTLSPYVYLIGEPGTVIHCSTNEKSIILQSHTKLLGVTIDYEISSGAPVTIAAMLDVVDDVTVRGCVFSASPTSGGDISCVEVGATITNLNIIGNVFGQHQPLTLYGLNMGYFNIIGNMQDATTSKAAVGCLGFIEHALMGGTSWGHRICHNRLRFVRYRAGTDPNVQPPYIWNMYGHSCVVDDNYVNYTDVHSSPGALGASLDVPFLTFHHCDTPGTLNVQAVRPNVVTNNRFTIRIHGDTGATHGAVCALLSEGTYTSGTMPAFYLRNNVFTYESDQTAAQTLKRVNVSQTQVTPTGTVYIQEDGAAGTLVDADDVLSHVTVSE